MTNFVTQRKTEITRIAHMSSCFHDPFSCPHLPPVAVRMTEVLMGAMEVEAV